MAHPDGLLRRRAVQDAALALAREAGRAVLALLGVADLAAELDGHDLLAVAEAKDRHAELEDARVQVGRVVGVHRGGAAGEDHRGRTLLRELGRGDVTGEDLGVDVQVTHPAGDELPILGAEIQNRDKLAGRSRLHASSNCVVSHKTAVRCIIRLYRH